MEDLQSTLYLFKDNRNPNVSEHLHWQDPSPFCSRAVKGTRVCWSQRLGQRAGTLEAN